MGRVSTGWDSAETISFRESVTSEASFTVLATLTFFWDHARAALLFLFTLDVCTSQQFTKNKNFLTLSLGLGRISECKTLQGAKEAAWDRSSAR